MKPFEKVIDYIKKEKNVDVVLDAQVTCNIRSVKRIFMHFNWNMEKNGLMVLLHEAGHALQPKEYVVEAVRKFEDDECSKEDVCRAQWFEEVDAWERGEQLAKDLNLDIDWGRFKAMKRKGLKSYEKYNV